MMPVLWMLAVTAVGPPPTEARIVVAIGNNLGIGADEPLDYAEQDARRFRQLMIEIGGVARNRAYLVLGENAAGVRKVLYEVRGRLQELANEPRATLIVFVSAHADQDALHLSGTTLAISELRALVQTSGADLKLTVIDACQTAATTKKKGGRPVPEVEIAFQAPSRVGGDVFLTSASPGEPAQERAFLRGALFSHHLFTGLRGAADVDGDRAISLDEAYGYAYRRTAATAAYGGAPQHPRFAIDMEGFGSWVLTRPGDHHAGLLLGPGIEGTVWVANRKDELVAEVAKTRTEVLRLALVAGWYRVVRPEGTSASVADVNLGWGGEQQLGPDDFVRVPMSRAKLRGDRPIVARPWQLAVGYAVGANPLPGPTLEHLAMLRVRRSFGAWRGRAQLTGTTSNFDFVNGRGRNWAVGLGVGASYVWPIAWLDFGLGVELNVTRVQQTFDRNDGDRIERLFNTTEPDRIDWVFGAAALSYFALPLSDRLWIQLELAAGGLRVPNIDGVGIDLMARAALLGGVQF